MKRFDYDDDEDENSPFYEQEMSGEEYEELMRRREGIDLMHIELANVDLRQQLISKSIKLLEKSFWWRFKSDTSKLASIIRVYNTLKILVAEEEE